MIAKRTIVTVGIVVMSAVFFCVGCITAPVGKSVEGRINHVVLCWLKNAGDQQGRAKIIEVSKTFREIPGVLEVRVGEVVLSDRDIVEDGYDVAIMLSFKSKADMDSYIAHPAHKKAVAEVLKPLVSKILVVDFAEK